MASDVQDIPAPPIPRRRPRQPAAAPSTRRKGLQLLLVFVTTVLVINALVGERGLRETLRARREYAELETSLARKRAENARLREHAERLRHDPATIEDIARRELRLIRPGEMLFIVKDARPAPASVR
jgi:cell division protein FtsB